MFPLRKRTPPNIPNFEENLMEESPFKKRSVQIGNICATRLETNRFVFITFLYIMFLIFDLGVECVQILSNEV